MYSDRMPQDPVMLLSLVNTKLRDDYSSLEVLCDDMQLDAKELQAKLLQIGYVYDPALNKFV